MISGMLLMLMTPSSGVARHCRRENSFPPNCRVQDARRCDGSMGDTKRRHRILRTPAPVDQSFSGKIFRKSALGMRCLRLASVEPNSEILPDSGRRREPAQTGNSFTACVLSVLRSGCITFAQCIGMLIAPMLSIRSGSAWNVKCSGVIRRESLENQAS